MGLNIYLYQHLFRWLEAVSHVIEADSLYPHVIEADSLYPHVTEADSLYPDPDLELISVYSALINFINLPSPNTNRYPQPRPHPNPNLTRNSYPSPRWHI